MRPRVVVNCAASADGKIATAGRRQARLSSAQDLARVAALRARCGAIMVGVGTVLADDPGLTAKGAGPDPLRVVVDSKGRCPPGAKVFDGRAPTLVATARESRSTFPNAEVVRMGAGRVDLPALVDELGRRGVREVLVEGGGTLIFAMLEAGLVDELTVFIADLVLGGAGAPTVADGAGFPTAEQAAKLEFVAATRMEGGLLVRYRVLPPT